jgi:hypothetical protein
VPPTTTLTTKAATTKAATTKAANSLLALRSSAAGLAARARSNDKSSEPVVCNILLIDAKAAAPSKEEDVQKDFASIAINR